jgi:hypothetical protein
MRELLDKDRIAQRLKDEFRPYLDEVRQDKRFKGRRVHDGSGAALAHFLNLVDIEPYIEDATAQSWLSARHVPSGEKLEKVLFRFDINKEFLLLGTGPRRAVSTYELKQMPPAYEYTKRSGDAGASALPIHLREPIELLSSAFDRLVESLNAHFGAPSNKKRPE